MQIINIKIQNSSPEEFHLNGAGIEDYIRAKTSVLAYQGYLI